MTIEAAIANLQTKLAALSGMVSTPAAPPEGAGGFPFAVTGEKSGQLEFRSAGFGDELATLWSEIHVNRANLSTDIVKAMTFRDAFLQAIGADITLGGTVSTVINVRWTLGPLMWGDTKTIGYHFDIDVKILLTY